ncbi:MAG: filamin/ABP280 repeat domain-containing protein [Cyclonatronaceae bacterium]
MILTATAASGWRFTGWQGDLSGNSNPATLVMNSDKNVTAVFVQDAPDMYTLAVQITGQGSVSVNPEKGQYESGEQVVLTATASSGWSFTGWQGDLSGSTNPATLVMNSNKSVTAVFVQDAPDMYTLAVQVTGQGSVSVNPQKDQYESGEQVVLTATAASGWSFTGWQGDLSGSTNPATLVMNSNKSVTAVFTQDAPEMYTLSVQVDGQGSVSVNPKKNEYESGEEVELTATPTPSWRFIGWQGDLSGNSNPATLVMNSDKSVTARFQRVGAPLMEILQQPSETTAGDAISPAPAVKLSNDLGNPISGADMSVRLNENSFTAGSTNTVTTNQDGHAIFNNLIIERAATNYRITFEADVQDASDVQSGPFDIIAAAPVADNSSADVPDGTSGEQTLIGINVRDRFDNPVTGAANQLRAGVSGANNTTTVIIETAVAGRYTAVYTPVVAGTDQITIEFAGNPISGSPYTSMVSANAPATVELISGDDQSGRVTSTLDNPFVVRVVDQNDNPVAGAAVEFTITETPAGAIGQRMSNTTVTTSADGIASSLLTLGSLPGVYRVVASADGAGAITFSASAEMLAPSLLTIVQQPVGTMAGNPINPAPSVRVTDSENNPIEGIALTVSLNGGEFADGSTTEILTGSNGISAFGNLVINEAASGYTLTFGSLVSGLANVTSQQFNVTAASGDPSQTSAIVPDGVAGEETRITIRVEDSWGNPTGSADDLTVEVAGENENDLKVTGTGMPGEFAAAYTPINAGTDVITIRLDGVEIPGSPYNSQVSAGSVDPSESTVTADPDELPVGSSSTVTVKLRDEFSNPVTGYTNADFVISLDGNATAGQVSETTEPGTYQFQVSSNVEGDIEVTVTVRGITLDDTPDIDFEEDEEESNTMGIFIQPENSKVGEPIKGPPAVRITNQFGNPVANKPVTVRERDGQPFASGTITVNTGGNGVAAFNDLVFAVTGRFQLEFSTIDAIAINSRTFQVTP